MDNYGVDKPDLRFENRICDVSSAFRSVSLPFLQEFAGKYGTVVLRFLWNAVRMVTFRVFFYFYFIRVVVTDRGWGFACFQNRI